MPTYNDGVLAEGTLSTAGNTAVAASVWNSLTSAYTTTGSYGARQGIEQLKKTITYSNGAGTGAIGSVVIATISGLIEIIRIIPRCTTSLTGATATIALGTTANTTLFIGAATATSILTGKYWFDATTTVYDDLAIPALLKEVTIEGNIINTVATANLTAGVIDYYIEWRPLSSGATLT